MICVFRFQLLLLKGQNLDLQLCAPLPTSQPDWNEISSDKITYHSVTSVRISIVCKTQHLHVNRLLQNWTYRLVRWKNPGVVFQAQFNPEAQIIWTNLFLFCFSFYWLFYLRPLAKPSTSPHTHTKRLLQQLSYPENVRAPFLARLCFLNNIFGW